MSLRGPFLAESKLLSLRSPSLWFVPAVAGLFLVAVSQYSYLAFHTLAEFFSIIVSFVLFALTWSTDRYRKNAFLIVLACGYFWIGGLDIAHTLFYKGMSAVGVGSGNLASQFWIGTRYVEAALLVFAPLAARMNINKFYAFGVFGVISTALFYAVMSGIFPTTFVEGVGLTDFKVVSEYIIIAVLVLSLIVLYQRRFDLGRSEADLIAAGIVLTIFAEIMFTLYVDTYGAFNFAGHLFKMASYWMIYQAVVVTSLTSPYEELAKSRDYNRNLFVSSSIGLVLMKMDGTLIDANPAYADIIGRSVEDTLSLTYWNITPEKYAIDEQAQLDSLQNTGRYGPYIKEYIHSDGHLVPVQLSGILIQHHGEVCIWSTVEDISARVEAEASAHEFMQRLQKLSKHLPGFIYQFRMRPDGSYHFPYASKGIRNVFGVTPQDVVDDASPLFAVLHPDDFLRVSETIRESAETLQSWSSEYRVILPNGPEKWVEGHSSPSKEDDGSIIWHGYIQDISARVAAGNQITHQRDQLRSYLNLAGTLVVALDRDGNVVLINKFASDLLGYDADALIGCNWFELAIPPVIRDELRNVADKIFNGHIDQHRHIENEVLTHSGERRLISWSNACLYDASGVESTILSSGIDITVERQAQVELEQSNRALRTVSHCNEALVRATNEDQLLNDICRSIVEEGGYQMAWTGFIRYNGGKHMVPTAIYGPNKDVVDAVIADINELDETAAMKSVHYSIEDGPANQPNCHTICEQNNISSIYVLPLKDAGETFGALFIARGASKVVTEAELCLLDELAKDLAYGIQALRMERERIYAMDKLAESEERSLAIVESAHDAIIAINEIGHITQFNPAAQTMFGYTLHEALGADVEIIIPERFRSQHSTSVRQFAKTHKGHIFGKNLSLTGLRSNGLEFPIELTLSPMPRNTTDLCTAIIRDVSDREEAERQRRQAQNMESLGNLAGGMAHDINNMLLPILNLTAMVKRTLGAKSSEDLKLGMVLQAAKRVQELVQRVLEFSRQDDPDFRDQDMHIILEKALPLIHLTTPSSIEVKTSIGHFKDTVYADEKQINAALINLVSNAVDAIGGSNGHIAINLKEAKPSQSLMIRNPALRSIPYAKISVIDDGCGMPSEVLERIFDPFFTTKEPGKGTGLGMSMIHGIVAKHGGGVDVRSSEGEGARIDLYFPLKMSPIKPRSISKRGGSNR